MRRASTVGLCAALLASGLAFSVSRAQDKPQPYPVPVSAIEYTARGTSLPFSTHMFLHRDGRAEWSSTLGPREGEFVGKASPHDCERLVKFLELVQFDQLAPTYGADGDDVPDQVFTVHRGADSRSITCYGSAAPVKLWAVYMSLRGIADTITWSPVAKEADK